MIGKLYRVINREVTLLFVANACFSFWRIEIPRERSESSIIFFRTCIKLSRCKFSVFRIRHSLGFSCQSGNTGLVELTQWGLDQLFGRLNLSVSSVRGTLRKFHRILVMINIWWSKCIRLAFRWCRCRIHSWRHNWAIGDQQLRPIVWFLIGLELLKAFWIDLKANLFLYSCIFGGGGAWLLR